MNDFVFLAFVGIESSSIVDFLLKLEKREEMDSPLESTSSSTLESISDSRIL